MQFAKKLLSVFMAALFVLGTTAVGGAVLLTMGLTRKKTRQELESKLKKSLQ